MADKPEALQLAGYWAAKNDQGEYLYSSLRFREETASELRRLHAVNQELLAALKHAHTWLQGSEPGRAQYLGEVIKAEEQK